MKIDRLYTLSQFIDELTLDFNESQSWMAEAYLAIHRYSEFLKQPLKKEMFVSSVLMPIFPNKVELTEFEQKLIAKYEEAQKKVIFDGMKPISGGNQFVCDYGYKELFRVICPSNHETLHDLAEATNGELKLKNIEL